MMIDIDVNPKTRSLYRLGRARAAYYYTGPSDRTADRVSSLLCKVERW
jgi:hypothetical protein